MLLCKRKRESTIDEVPWLRSNALLSKSQVADRRASGSCSVSVQVPTEKTRVSVKKSMKQTLRFAEERNKVHILPLSDGDFHDAWLQQQDYSLIREGIRETIRAVSEIRNGSKVRTDECCIRGLELFVSVFLFNASTSKQQRIVRSILLEQKRGKEQGYVDPESLRLVSKSFSDIDRHVALQSGINDAYWYY